MFYSHPKRVTSLVSRNELSKLLKGNQGNGQRWAWTAEVQSTHMYLVTGQRQRRTEYPNPCKHALTAGIRGRAWTPLSTRAVNKPQQRHPICTPPFKIQSARHY